MEPVQPSRFEAPTPCSSPLQPPLNGAERPQRIIPLPLSLGSSTTDEEPPIFSPIPIRPRPSQVSEAGPSMTSWEIAPINTAERLRRLSRLRQRQQRRGRLEEEEPKGAEGDGDQRRRELIARSARRLTDGLADDLSALSTNEPELNPVEEDMERRKHGSRKLRTRKGVIARDQLHAERAQQMRDIEQRIQGGSGGMGVVEEEGSASGTTAADVQPDISSIFRGPTEDSDAQMSNTQSPNHLQLEETQ